jgi:hypothetical protein
MPQTEPGKPVPLQPQAAPEQLVAEWTEPNEKLAELSQLPLVTVIIGAAILIGLLIGLGVWLRDFTLYMAAAASLAAAVAVISQRRRPAASRTVSLTTQNLVVGRRTYPLSDLAGFWLESVGEVTAVNVEPSKAAVLPINFLYPSAERAEARATLLEVLPELEPRHTTAGDSLSRYIRL